MAALSRVLIVNTGSSSLKWTLLDAGGAALAGGDAPWSGDDAAGQAEQLRAALAPLPRPDAVGHRVVHGGTRFRAAVLVDAAVRAQLEELAELDPLHMRPALAGLDAAAALGQGLPQVAAFDTAFHATLPEAAAGYGLPYDWAERYGARRFGFHGLSVSYAAGRVRELLGHMPARVVVCHLGSGSSLTALLGGRSVDTTMGFSPLEGVVMATRSGSVDPGLVLHLLRSGLSADELAETLNRRSGLLGLSGVSADLREVLAAAAAGSARAQLAYDRLLLSLRRHAGAMVGVLGGIDALVFTGGIGEHSAQVRGDLAASLAFTGLALAPPDPEGGGGDRDLATPASPVRALVIHAREDLAVLAEVQGLLGPGRRPTSE